MTNINFFHPSPSNLFKFVDSKKLRFMKRIVLILLAIVMIAPEGRSDEGMWLPMFVKRLNYTDMQAQGLKLTPEEIYDINNSSLKDAILGLGSPGRNFCTGEIISKEGLFLTNHHCGYGVIQKNSTVDNNYLKDGFWAMKRSDEIPAGINVSILDRMKDVTSIVLEGVDPAMSTDERRKIIGPRMDSLKEANSEGNMEAVVKSFYKGNEYYMFIYKVYKDIRFVGAPPSAVGKFGGDTDNWMWPRHTGDFTLFRIYADKDNNPAEYSEDNVPLKPKHHLPVNIKGVNTGDFAMIFGFPGSTERYLSSYGIEHKIDKEYPTRIKARRMKLDRYEEGMNKDEAVRIQYASKHAGVSNYWKNFIGMNKALRALGVKEQKAATEAQFAEWAKKDPKRSELYGGVLDMYEEGYEALLSTQKKRDLFVEGFLGIEMLGLAGGAQGLDKALSAEEVSDEEVAAMAEKMKAGAVWHFKNYNLEVDRNIMSDVFEMMYTQIPMDQLPTDFKTLIEKGKKDYVGIAEKIFSKSIFASSESLNSFLESPKAKTLQKDPAYKLYTLFFNDYMENTYPTRSVAGEKINTAERLFIRGLREMNPNEAYYPDANSTLRLTYGTVSGYEPKDATTYKYFTTAQGILEKYVPGDLEFDVPEKLINLIKAKDYGQYGKDGVLKVCFLSNNDITGGNSGSPVINAEGYLIGTAFDGNWEAMSGDVAFEPNLQRTISVDIRYTLFIIDKYAGATHLIDEMTLVK